MNMTVTNVDTGNVIHSDAKFEDGLLTLTAADIIAEGTILARDSVSLKYVPFVKGGGASKTTSAGPFNLDPGDTMVLDVNNVGNATATWDAAAATITDTTSYAVTDQDGLTMTVTLTGGLFDGVVQTVTFSGATTTAAVVAAQMNTQLDGCSVAVVGGQVVITHDSAGTDMDIATGAGTGNLTWATSVAGTGDVADIDAVTAAEVKTVVEADTTATVTVSGLTAVFTASTELDFISGLALAKMGLSVETITANGNGVPKAVLTYDVTSTGAGDLAIRPMIEGKVRQERLIIDADGSATNVDNTVRDQLRDYGITPLSVNELNILDNQ